MEIQMPKPEPVFPVKNQKRKVEISEGYLQPESSFGGLGKRKKTPLPQKPVLSNIANTEKWRARKTSLTNLILQQEREEEIIKSGKKRLKKDVGVQFDEEERDEEGDENDINQSNGARGRGAEMIEYEEVCMDQGVLDDIDQDRERLKKEDLLTNEEPEIRQPHQETYEQEETDKYLAFLHELRVSQSVLEYFELQVITSLQKQIAILHKERTRVLALAREGTGRRIDGVLNVKLRLHTIKKRLEMLKGKLNAYQQFCTVRPTQTEKFAIPRGLNALFLKSRLDSSTSSKKSSHPSSQKASSTGRPVSPLSKPHVPKPRTSTETGEVAVKGISREKNPELLPNMKSPSIHTKARRRTSYSAPNKIVMGSLEVENVGLGIGNNGVGGGHAKKNLMVRYSGAPKKSRQSLIFSGNIAQVKFQEQLAQQAQAITNPTTTTTTTTGATTTTSSSRKSKGSSKKVPRISDKVVKSFSNSQRKIEQRRLSDLVPLPPTTTGDCVSQQPPVGRVKSSTNTTTSSSNPTQTLPTSSSMSPNRYWEAIAPSTAGTDLALGEGEEPEAASDEEHEDDDDHLLTSAEKNSFIKRDPNPPMSNGTDISVMYNDAMDEALGGNTASNMTSVDPSPSFDLFKDDTSSRLSLRSNLQLPDRNGLEGKETITPAGARELVVPRSDVSAKTMKDDSAPPSIHFDRIMPTSLPPSQTNSPTDMPVTSGSGPYTVFDPDAEEEPGSTRRTHRLSGEENFTGTIIEQTFRITTLSTFIFEYLSGMEILPLLTVCKLWNRAIKDSPLLQKSLSQTEKGKSYSNLQATEGKFILGDYLHKQPQINAKMRAILVDWIADVSGEFRHSDETLHLAIRLIDRLLESVPVPRRELQLVGCAAILIAAKIEEIYPPSIDTLLYLCDKIYTKEQILQMEAVVLERLQFSFQCPTAWTFMQHFFQAFTFEPQARYFAHFLVELTLQEYELVKYSPSCVATTIACLALYSTSLPYHPLLTLSGYAPVDIIPVARVVRSCLERQRILINMKAKEREHGQESEMEAALLVTTVEKFSHNSKLRVARLNLKSKFEEDLVRLYAS